MRESGKPQVAAVVAAPDRKLWEEKLEGVRLHSAARCLIERLSRLRERVEPDDSVKRLGEGVEWRRRRYSWRAVDGHKVG